MNESEDYPFTVVMPNTLVGASKFYTTMNMAKYAVNRHNNDGHLGFDEFDSSYIAKFDGSDLTNLFLGNIKINNTFAPIDATKNKTALNALSDFYNCQKNNGKTYTCNYDYYVKEANIFDLYDFIKIESDKMESGKGNAFSSNLALMYDPAYCSMAYRSAKNFSDVSINNGVLVYTAPNTPAKLPVFSIETAESNPQAWVVVRGFKFELRRIKTSSEHYVFEYPEYIFKAGKYRNSDIDYIETNVKRGTVWYSYANDEKDLYLNEKAGESISTVSEELQAMPN
jgi:hypothetical protein